MAKIISHVVHQMAPWARTAWYYTVISVDNQALRFMGILQVRYA